MPVLNEWEGRSHGSQLLKLFLGEVRLAKDAPQGARRDLTLPRHDRGQRAEIRDLDDLTWLPF